MEFYCFLLMLRRYLQEGKRNPIPLRPFIHQIAGRLPVEESLTDRRLLGALQFYAVDSWWPDNWGEPPVDRWLFIHDGKFLHVEVEALLEEIALQHNLNLDLVPCDALDGILANDAFNKIRLDLMKQWAENPDERDNIETAYRQLRLILAENVAVNRYELQRQLTQVPYFDLRTVRGSFYLLAENLKHMVDSDENFILCNRCGLRNSNETTCIRPRCPGQKGWTYVSLTPQLMLLHPEHITRIVIPAVEELSLYQHIKSVVEPAGGQVILWPAIDRFDIYVTTPEIRIAIDVKDWEHPEQLARNISGDIPNYAPYPYDLGAYVYPADRGGDYGQIVRERAGSRLITNRIMNTSSIMQIIKKAIK